MEQPTRPIGVIYEHEDWLAPLFASLEDAGLPFERVFADAQVFDPAAPRPDWSLALNKISPSSYLRGTRRASPTPGRSSRSSKSTACRW